MSSMVPRTCRVTAAHARRAAAQVADDLQAELGLALDAVGKMPRLWPGADDQHLATDAAVAAHHFEHPAQHNA